MTVAAKTPEATYFGDGITTAFAAEFRFLAGSLLVQGISADGSVVNYAPGVDFSTSGGATDAGGMVTMVTPPASGIKLRIRRRTPRDQISQYPTSGNFPSQAHEQALDRNAMSTQDQDVTIASLGTRGLLAPEGQEAPELSVFDLVDGDILQFKAGKLQRLDRSKFAGKIYAGDASGAMVPATPGSGGDGALRSDLAAADGPGLVAFSPVTDYSAGSVGGKLAQLKAVNDYAAPAEAAAADADGEILLVARDAVSLIPDGASLNSKYWGFGQVRTADGNKRGKYFSALKAPPAVTGNSDSVDTAFNGDFAGHFIIEHRISGVGTLGTPATGYLYRNEAVPVYAVMYVAPEAGHNEQLTGNNGRTGTAIFRGDVKHYGNGDAVVYNGTLIVAGNKAGATSWLAQPAGVLFNGDMQAGAHHVYLNPRELHLKDSGFDVSCIGDVVNMSRTNGTGEQDVLWAGYRAQSLGTVAVNTLFSATGLFNCGIDLSMSFLQFGGNGAAISMKALDRIYFNNASDNDLYTTVFNGDWMAYIPGSGIVIATEGSATVQIADDRVVFTVPTLTPSLTVAALPAAIPENRGLECCVTNATSNTRGAVVAGGGANFVKVLCNGAAWIIQ